MGSGALWGVEAEGRTAVRTGIGVWRGGRSASSARGQGSWRHSVKLPRTLPPTASQLLCFFFAGEPCSRPATATSQAPLSFCAAALLTLRVRALYGCRPPILNMDVYPPQYVEHNLPFVVLSGLGENPSDDSQYQPHALLKERGIEIDSAVPVVTGDRADQLRQEFLSADARSAPWNGLRTRARGDHVGFRLKAVGRVGQGHQCLPSAAMQAYRSIGLRAASPQSATSPDLPR